MFLKYFDFYVSLGWKPIPVYRETKIPAAGRGWNGSWNYETSRQAFQDGDYNIGLLLGDIVDVEGDTDEANDLLERMIDGLPHPMYQSSKSVHHIFQNPDPTLTRLCVYGIEFRAHKHFSVAPPSLHETGCTYRFLKGSIFQPPPLPPELATFYQRNKNSAPKKKAAPRQPHRKPQVKDGHTKTYCKICNQPQFIHKKRLRLEVLAFQEHGLPWMCHGCRELDVREACRRIRKEISRNDNRINRVETYRPKILTPEVCLG